MRIKWDKTKVAYVILMVVFASLFAVQIYRTQTVYWDIMSRTARSLYLYNKRYSFEGLVVISVVFALVETVLALGVIFYDD